MRFFLPSSISYVSKRRQRRRRSAAVQPTADNPILVDPLQLSFYSVNSKKEIGSNSKKRNAVSQTDQRPFKRARPTLPWTNFPSQEESSVESTIMELADVATSLAQFPLESRPQSAASSPISPMVLTVPHSLVSDSF